MHFEENAFQIARKPFEREKLIGDFLGFFLLSLLLGYSVGFFSPLP